MVQFSVVCADPAWQFKDKLPGKTRGAEKQYRCMSLEDIAHMELPPIADDAYLFLWRVASMVEEAYYVGHEWGFRPVTEIVWLKLTKTGKPWFGMGHTTREAHETAIVFKRGKPRPLVKNERDIFEARVPVDANGKYIHSAKPDEFYAKVERLCGGPYVEMFARKERNGWTCIGDEMPVSVDWYPALDGIALQPPQGHAEINFDVDIDLVDDHIGEL